MSEHIKDGFNTVSREYDENRRKLIPCFDRFYGMILEQIPQAGKELKVLDIGAGTGLLSAMILERYPHANITLIDIAEKMLDQARERFGKNENIKYIAADYSEYDFTESFDVIVSSLSIHHLTHEKKKELYQTLFDQLNPGGLFINGDQFLATTEEREKRNQSWWRKTIESAGIDLNQLYAWEKRTAMDIPATVNENINWMNDAGFANTDIIFKEHNFGVIIGEKRK